MTNFKITWQTKFSGLALVLSLCGMSTAGWAEQASKSMPTKLAQQAVESAKFTQQLDAYIKKGMVDWKIPGLSIVVVNDQGVLYEKGFGVRQLGKPDLVDTHTAFGMMSTTKAMTALAIAMLVDEGKLRWDDPVIKHLPNLRLPNAYLTEHVTVRDTLRHTSGVESLDLLWVREDMNTKDVLRRLEHAPTTTALRSDFVYNNVMYQVAGEVVSAVSGMSWERFVATRILAAIGMTESYASLAAMRASGFNNVSLPHFEIDQKTHVIEDVTIDVVPAAGAAWSNAHDTGKWLNFLLAGGKVGEKRLVSEASFKELFLPQVAVHPSQWGYSSLQSVGSRFTAYGLGWFLQDYRGHFVAMHTGSMDGRTAIIGLIPDAKIGVYIFGNLDHAEFRHALMWKVFDSLLQAPSRDWSAELLKISAIRKAAELKSETEEEKKRVANTQPSHALTSYVGTYTHKVWGDMKVTLENGVLTIQRGATARNLGQLQHWHFDSFRTKFGDGRNGWETLSFITAPDGNIKALEMDNVSFVKLEPSAIR